MFAWNFGKLHCKFHLASRSDSDDSAFHGPSACQADNEPDRRVKFSLPDEEGKLILLNRSFPA
jgi:hypothetical protein